MGMRWVTIYQSYREKVGSLLVALRKEFPGYEFKLGRKGPLCGVKDCLIQNVLGKMPYPHPNADTWVIIKWCYEFQEYDAPMIPKPAIRHSTLEKNNEA